MLVQKMDGAWRNYARVSNSQKNTCTQGGCYEDFFSIILLRLMNPAYHLDGTVMETACNTLNEVLAQEARETDILGTMDEDAITILHPYADARSTELVQRRFNDLLRP